MRSRSGTLLRLAVVLALSSIGPALAQDPLEPDEDEGALHEPPVGFVQVRVEDEGGRALPGARVSLSLIPTEFARPGNDPPVFPIHLQRTLDGSMSSSRGRAGSSRSSFGRRPRSAISISRFSTPTGFPSGLPAV